MFNTQWLLVERLSTLFGLIFVISAPSLIVWYHLNKRLIKPLRGSMRDVFEKLDAIIEGQRLSVVINLDAAKALKVDPKIFEPNKERIKTRILQAVRTVTHPQPPTRAYLILEESGISQFLEGKTRLNIQAAMARLITNGDMTSLETFCTEVVDKL